MLIALLTDNLEDIATLALGLRAAGHLLRAIPLDATDLIIDGQTPDAVLVRGGYVSPALVRFADEEPQRCVMALLTPNVLASFVPDGPHTDFAVAPFRAAEVACRLALHQSRQRTDDTEVIRSGNLVIDVNNYTVSVHDERIELTFKEYELLKFLVSHVGRVFTRESLLEHVWGYDYWGGSRTIDVHIRRIRSKLPATTAALIETVHQVGYRFATARG